MKRTVTTRLWLVVLPAAIGLVLASPALAAATYGGGTGTKDDPFLISAKEHLEALRWAVNAGNRYAGTYFKLTRGIDLEEELWTPIGKDDTAPFAGHLDSISGFAERAASPRASSYSSSNRIIYVRPIVYDILTTGEFRETFRISRFQEFGKDLF